MRLAVFLLIALLHAPVARADAAIKATLYKTPDCDCCEGYADYLRHNGFQVTVVPTPNLSLMNRERGVPEDLDGCHLTMIDGYMVEGHVPIDAVKRLLALRPAIKGISLPGMPEGSPGMFGPKRAPFTIYEIKGGNEVSPKVFVVE